MTTSTEFLNTIAKATGSTDKNAVITMAMGMLVKNGVSGEVAMDYIFGEGAYKRFAGQVYDALRAA